MKKLIFTFLIFSLILSLPISFLEAENFIPEYQVQSSDLGVGEPNVLPNHPFYFIRDWTRNVRSILTFDSVKKAELEFQFANEKLLELRKIVEMESNEDLIEKTISSYQSRIEKTEKATNKIQEQAENNEQVKNFSEEYSQQQILHQRILEKLEDNIPEKSLERIREVRSNNLESFQNILIKVQGVSNIPETINEAFNNIDSGSFDEIKNIRILEKVKENLPSEYQEKIEEKKEERIEKLKSSLEGLSSENQSQLKEYIEKIDEDQEIILNIIDNLKGKILREDTKEIINNVRDSYLQKIKEQTGADENSVVEKIDYGDDLIEGIKSLILEKGLNKSIFPEVFELVEESEIDLEKAQEYFEKGDYIDAFIEIRSSQSLSNNIKSLIQTVGGYKTDDGSEISCTSIFVPVCGEDGNTYQNICEAQKANVEILYRGECQTELPCANEGEEVNRNPVLGPTHQECCNGLQEIRISRSYSICEEPSKKFECQTDQDCPLPDGSSSEKVKCVDGECVFSSNTDGSIMCIQVITPAQDPAGGECVYFPTPCDVPEGWVNCSAEIQLKNLNQEEESQSGLIDIDL